MVGRPSGRGAPMPVEHMLSILLVMILLYTFPEGIGACSQLLFVIITLLEIFPYTDQCLRHKSRFHDISAIVILAEGFDFSCRPMQPMRPCPMKTFDLFKETKGTVKPLQCFRSRDEPPFNAHQQRHQPKAAAAYRYDVFVVLRVFAIDVDTLTG